MLGIGHGRVFDRRIGGEASNGGEDSKVPVVVERPAAGPGAVSSARQTSFLQQ